VAYVTDRTGRNEVYVTSFPTARAQTQISNGGGDFPVWSRDGKELFYVGPDSRLMRVAVKVGTQFEADIPQALFEVRFSSITSNMTRFDVSKDGRFLIPVERDPSVTQSIVAVIDWTAGLKR
jgi:Tol biopolymer transport system component